MSRHLISQADAAFHEFDRLIETVMAELERHRDEIDAYDRLVERHLQLRNAGLCFLYEAAVALREHETGKSLSQLLAEAYDAPRAGRMLQ